ncbi:MAG: hypothetical protein EA398_18080 [Deltaproteobacteria bacterium]|nr:MAG: hypothetical protein EA398_18080 [Deltaproteobacteria bacterium]
MRLQRTLVPFAAAALLLAASGCAESTTPEPAEHEVRDHALTEFEVARIYSPEMPGSVLLITRNADLGWNVSMRDHDRTVDPAPAELAEFTAEVSFEFLALHGVNVDKSFEGGSGGSVRFSSRSGARSGFGANSGASTRFGASSGASVGFRASLGSGYTCDLAGFCDFLADLVCSIGDAQACSEVRAAAAECRRELASASIPPEIEAFVCLFLRLLTCILSAGFEGAERVCGIDAEGFDIFIEFDDDGDWGDSSDWSSWDSDDFGFGF